MQPPPRKVNNIKPMSYIPNLSLCVVLLRQFVEFVVWIWDWFVFKVKHTTALKNIHSEQVSKLQNKVQQDCDLLDDIR